MPKLQSHKTAEADEIVEEFMRFGRGREGRNDGATIQLGIEERERAE